jgi:hypothetical protein
MSYPRLIEPTATPLAELAGAGDHPSIPPSLTSEALSLLSQLFRSLSDWLDRPPAGDRVIDGDGNFWSIDDLDRIEKESGTEIASLHRGADTDPDEDRLLHWSLYCLL